jgi:hypothetical protein
MIAAKGRAAPPPVARPGRSPLVAVLREPAQRPAISELELTPDGDTVGWRRA